MATKCVTVLLTGLILLAQSAVADDGRLNESSRRPKLLFRSGFEGLVDIISIGKRHKISGVDGKYRWPTGLPGAGNRNYFNYIVSRKKDYSKFIDTQIVTVSGQNGKPTRVLYQAIIKNDKDTRALSRNQYNMFSSATADDFKNMYVRYWKKLQPDLNKVMPKNSWRMMMEWFESGYDYRFNLQVFRHHRGGKLKWRLLGQFLKPKRKYDWRLVNSRIPVPIGEWFLLEAFWRHSTGPDGRIIVKINGEELFNHAGRNKINSKISVFMPFKCYGGTGYSHWIDDFEIWDSIPHAASR